MKKSHDEPIVELETDKVNVEVPSPISGVIGSITVKEGETVNVGSLLGTVNNSSDNAKDDDKEVTTYSPPKKKKKQLNQKFLRGYYKTKKNKI